MDFPISPSHTHPQTQSQALTTTNQDGRIDSHDDIEQFDHDNDESMLLDNDEKDARLSSTPTTAAVHKRTYQACEPCRMRKVRCDLGSVDAPTDPPCQRCRREKKTCYFTDTRRKRKAGDGPDNALTDDYIVRNRRTLPVMQDGIIEPAATSEGRPSLGPHSHSSGKAHRVRGEGGDVRNETAAEWFKEPINQPSDAFRLLVHAASKEQAESLRPSGQTQNQLSLESRVTSMQQAIDPSSNATEPPIDPAAERDLQIAIKAWNRVRFVRAGWFSAREGVDYIEYFYKELSPMTSVSLPILNGPAGHPKLLEEEPMLTVTLLTIASRYLVLKGAGRTSRSMYIHQTMWNYLQDMITRMYWGQEQNVVARQNTSNSKNDDIRQGLRTLGTVESLLLLSDWHPRSLHFPPNTDTGSIIAPAAEEIEVEEKPADFPGKGLYSEWSEPLLRSDLMSWSLVSSAYTLAVELGVMDSLTTHGHWVPYEGGRASNDHERADRAGRLVHIYVSQTCGRLGYPNLLPNLGENMRIDYMRMPDDASGVDVTRQEILIDTAQRAWAELAAIMRDVNARLFPSKSETSQIIQSGRYKALVDGFSTRLKEWRKRFERFKMPKVPGTTLLMEFEYSRTYVHSLSLQAVMEQSAMFVNEHANSSAGETDGPGSSTTTSVSAKLVEIAKQNEAHINELIDASRNLLTHVIKDLWPCGALKHAPVRTNFRILSAAMFLLKTFAIGGKEAEMYKSLDVIANTAEVLGRSSIDDLQLAATVSDLLTRLTVSIGTKFRKVPSPLQRQVQKKQRGSTSRGMPSGPSKSGVRRRESANTRAIPRSDILKPGPVDSLAARPRIGDVLPSPLSRSQSDAGPTTAQNANVPPGYAAHPIGNPPIGFANYPATSPGQVSLNYNAYTPDGMTRSEYMQSTPPIAHQGMRFSPSTGGAQTAVYSPHSTASNPALNSPGTGVTLDSNGQAPYDWWQLGLPQGGNNATNAFGPGLEEGLEFFEAIANWDDFTGPNALGVDEDLLGLQGNTQGQQGQVNGRGATGQGSALYY